MKTEVRGNPPSLSFQNPNLLPISGALTGCIEKLLLHCASALEQNDVTLAQQVMWVLNNVASFTGDPNQRLASYFLKALISKASRICPITTAVSFASSGRGPPHRRLMSVTELAGYVDLIPWHRFGFCASNSAIIKAVEGFSRVHVLDFSITYCMQWPTLIDALAKGPNGLNGPPLLRVTVLSWRPNVPPLLNVSIEEIGHRLSNFAKFKDVPFEFNVVEVDVPNELSSLDHLHYDLILRQLNACTLKIRGDEGLVVNCQNWLRYLPDEQMAMSSCDDDHISCRNSFLGLINKLNPRVVTVVDEDCDLGESSGLATRITTCFNYMWIPFDALETFMPKNSPQRMEYEAHIGQKIENVIGFDGPQRIERSESSTGLARRMGNNGFLSVPFCEETVKEVKVLLDEHASGWGMKRDEDMLILTWKGHNSIYATVWVPRASEMVRGNFVLNDIE